MKIYFLSDRVCALRLGNLYFGQVDSFERFAHINLSDRVFVEFIPENALPVCFFLTEEILREPPLNCDVYILRDALVLYAHDFPAREHTLRPIAQISRQNCTATLFSQGEIQLSIQTPENFFIAPLPPSFCQAELFFDGDFIFVKGLDSLAVFSPNGQRLFLEKVHSYALNGDILSVEIPLSESLGRTAECRFALSLTECQRISVTLSSPRAERREEWLAYTFFESVRIGAVTQEFLCDELKPRADELRAFLGDFVHVMPTDEKNCCALLYKKAERLYEAKYYSVSTENGQILDITT